MPAMPTKSRIDPSKMYVCRETVSLTVGPEAWDFETLHAGERRSGADPLVADYPQWWADELEVTPEELAAEQARKYTDAAMEARVEERKREQAERERLRREAEAQQESVRRWTVEFGRRMRGET